jgi:putative acetyltransferase
MEGPFVPDPVVVRPATEGDLDGIIDCFEIVASEGRWIATELPLDRDDRRAKLSASLEAGECNLLVEAEGRVVGSGGLRAHAPGVFELGMALVPEWRGRGAGSKLLSALIECGRAQGGHKLALEVWPHNAAAIGLYEKFGFEREGYLRRHYRRRSGELWDSVVMGLSLAPD